MKAFLNNADQVFQTKLRADIRCSGMERGLVWVGSGIHPLPAMFSLSGRLCTARSRAIGRPQPDQAAQVLNGCHQQKLFSCSGKPSQFQPSEAEMLLHVSKEYFHLLAQAS